MIAIFMPSTVWSWSITPSASWRVAPVSPSIARAIPDHTSRPSLSLGAVAVAMPSRWSWGMLRDF